MRDFGVSAITNVMEQTPDSPAPIPLWPTLMRGLKCRCPKCGDAPLFRAYLKPVENCAACGENLGVIRADDGPAWMTLMLVGHLFAFGLLFMEPTGDEPEWLGISLLLGLTTVLSLLTLHYSKGFFIALIWRLEAQK